MRFSGLLARFPLVSSLLVASLLGAACAAPSTPPPAMGGDDKPVKDPDQLGGKNGPTFYSADTPPPPVDSSTSAGPATPGGPVKLSTTPSTGARSLKLLSAGAEPHEKRIYSPKVGAKETLVVTSKTSTTMSAAGQALPGGDQGLPPSTLEIALVVKEVSEGQIKSDFVVKKASSTAKGGHEESQKYAASIVALKDAKGTVSTTRGGDAIAVEIDESSGDAAKDALRDALLTPSIPFPPEPIGDGAKWEVRHPSVSGGLRIEQTTTYELSGLSKGKGKIAMTIRVTAPAQDVEIPGAPAAAHLDKLEGSGTGSAAFDLTKITARSFTQGTTSKATITVSMMGTDMAAELGSKNDTKRIGK